MAFGAVLSLLTVAALGVRSPDPMMVSEAVNDHLRVLSSEHPLDLESSNMHQVKPWFAGKLDFAPLTEFAGDEEFPLMGGLVGYFIDRKAATLVFKRHSHTITLLVFPSKGLPWPTIARGPAGSSRQSHETSRGFHVLLWQRQDLGYALVSDTNEADLMELAAKISGP
jgi:anti-sigma factor RsiW